MRRIALLIILAACDTFPASPDPNIQLSFPEVEASGGQIPFRMGGPFSVTLTAKVADLGDVSHATVEIVSGAISADATASANVTLQQVNDTDLVGTAILKWPLGGPAPDVPPLLVRADVGNRTEPVTVPLEQAIIAATPGSLSNTGAQLVQSVCFDSSSTDGALTVHVNGGKLESGMTDGSVPLLPGNCSGSLDVKNPSSFAKIKITVSDPAIEITATLPPTTAAQTYAVTAPAQGTLTLDLATASTMPARESIVDVTATAKVNGVPTKNIVVIFETIPAISVTPASAKTDTAGHATASFQMPKEGSLRVIATSGDTHSAPIDF